MSDTIKKTNSFVKFIGNKLGLVTQEEIQDFVKKENGGVPSTNRPDMRSSMLIGQAIPPDMKAEDYLKAYVGWVFSCVNILATETANIDLTLYKRSSQNEFKVIESHRALDLLYKVNPLYTSYLLWEATEAYMDLTGEAFWWLIGPVNNPKEIWLLRPDWVNIKDTKGKLISSYQYGPPGDNKITIPYEQIIHFKDFNPRNLYRGYGLVKAGAKSIDENTFQQDYNRNFFYNSALPGGALETDNNLTEDQYKRIRDDWEAVHRGSKKAWKIAILEAGLKWQDIGLNQKDMDFIEGRKLTRDEVLANFRIPKPLLTFDDVNRAAAKEARAILLENVITHKMKRLVSFLNEFYLPRFGDEDIFFDYKNPVPDDDEAKLRLYDNALKHGWMTRNEVREMENKEPIKAKAADSLMIPFSLQDAGATQTPEEKAAQKKRDLIQFNVRTKPYSFFKTQMDSIQNNLVEICTRLIKSMSLKKARNGEVIHKLSTKDAQEGEIVVDAEREARWRTVVTRTDQREIKYKQLINDLFIRQEEKVQKALDTGLTKSITKATVKTTSGDIEDIIVNDSDVFIETLMSFIRTVIEAEGIQQIQSIVSDGIFYMATPAIQKYLKKEGAKFVTALNEETAEQIRLQLADAIEKKESISQIKARVTSVYEDARGYRAEAIARTEVARATNFSAEQAYIQSGVVVQKEWLTAHDERTCPWCGPMDGKRIDLGKSFYEMGDQVVGTNDKGKKVTLTVGVSDIDHPPLHPNCRCTLIPVVAESEKHMNSKDLLGEVVSATIKEIKQSQNQLT